MTMLDKLIFDQSTYPNTRYVANLILNTGSGYKWCIDFFDWARQEVGAKRVKVDEAFVKFKELLSGTFPQDGILRVPVDSVDWRALFNLVEENTRLASIEVRKRNPRLGQLLGRDVPNLNLENSKD